MTSQFVSPSIEIELISHCFKNVDLLEECIVKIPFKYFGSEATSRIYYELIEFYKKWNKIPSKIEIEQRIKDFNSSEEENILAFLDRAFSEPSTNSVDYLIEQIKLKYKARSLVNSIKSISEFLKKGDIQKSEDEMMKFLNSSSEEEKFKQFEISNCADEILDEVLNNKDKEFDGIPTGIVSLDSVFRGLKRQELGIIVGKTGGFKSTLMTNMAVNAFLMGKKVAIFVIESPPAQYFLNMFSYISGVNADLLHESKISKQDIDSIKSKLFQIGKKTGGKIFIKDCPQGLTPGVLQMEIRKLKRKEGIDLVIIDYMQIMELEGKSQTDIYDWKSIVSISKMIKLIARAEDIPIWTAAQHVDKKHDDVKEHSTEDIAFGKAVSHNADVVLKIFQTPQDQIINQMKIYYLKLRRKARGLTPAIVEPNINCMRVCEISARNLLKYADERQNIGNIEQVQPKGS